uniref:coiled-coil domain-containing protein 6 n=1 Tax=Myxine glutinosa TaxID=7769 RepID=UPI00358EEB56
MADSAGESDTDGSGSGKGALGRLAELHRRVASLQQENKVLKIELETYKLKCKALQEENKELRRASVTIQARAEQEEEFISNTLFKKIQALKKEKETLAMNYEQEEEFLTNELSRKLMQLRQEKAELEQTLEQEQEFQINKLMKKIKKLESETLSKQQTLEQLRREKIDLENTLEQEQEALVNRLWKRMDRLEAEKRILQEKLEQPVSALPSPQEISMEMSETPENLVKHISFLRHEVERLKQQLCANQLQHSEKMAHYLEEERHMREENLRLQRKLQREVERREALCRQLSESESSLEMDDERHFNEMASQGIRPRTVSSPVPYSSSPSHSRPISPGLSLGTHPTGFTPPTTLSRATPPGHHGTFLHSQLSPAGQTAMRPSPKRSGSPDHFKRPTPPPSPNTAAFMAGQGQLPSPYTQQ